MGIYKVDWKFITIHIYYTIISYISLKKGEK